MNSIHRSFRSNQICKIIRRSFSVDGKSPKSADNPSKSQTTVKSTKSESNKQDISVPGLSSQVLNVPSNAIGPGASKTGSYKNPEYFSYHQTSYFDAEIEMAKFRIPQPSAKFHSYGFHLKTYTEIVGPLFVLIQNTEKHEYQWISVKKKLHPKLQIMQETENKISMIDPSA